MNTVRATRGVARTAAVPIQTRPRRPVRRPELRVVEGRGEGARRRLVPAVVAMAGGVFFASLLGLAVFHVFLVQSQSTIDGIDLQIGEASTATEDLRLRLAELESPDRIRAVARDELGLVEPSDVVMLQPGDLDAFAATVVPDAYVAPPSEEPLAASAGGELVDIP